MATITVRNLPDEVIAALKERARRHHRSMEQEVRTILAEVLVDRETARKRIEFLWREIKRPVGAEEAAEWLRNARQWRRGGSS